LDLILLAGVYLYWLMETGCRVRRDGAAPVALGERGQGGPCSMIIRASKWPPAATRPRFDVTEPLAGALWSRPRDSLRLPPAHV